MGRIRFSLSTAFALLTYLCVMAAAGGVFRHSLRSGDDLRAAPIVARVLLGGWFVGASIAIGGYCIHRLTRVYLSRSWRRTTAIVLPPPKQHRFRSEQDAGGMPISRVEYEFEVDERRYTSSIWVAQRYDDGDQRPLAFDAADPDKHCFDPGCDTATVAVIALVMVVFGGLGLAVIFF